MGLEEALRVWAPSCLRQGAQPLRASSQPHRRRLRLITTDLRLRLNQSIRLDSSSPRLGNLRLRLNPLDSAIDSGPSAPHNTSRRNLRFRNLRRGLRPLLILLPGPSAPPVDAEPSAPQLILLVGSPSGILLGGGGLRPPTPSSGPSGPPQSYPPYLAQRGRRPRNRGFGGACPPNLFLATFFGKKVAFSTENARFRTIFHAKILLWARRFIIKK